MHCVRLWLKFHLVVVRNQPVTLLCVPWQMKKEKDIAESAQKPDLLEPTHLKETFASSPEYYATLPCVARVVQDPISYFGLKSAPDKTPEAVEVKKEHARACARDLGHREDDVNRKEAQPFGIQEQAVTQKNIYLVNLKDLVLTRRM